MISTSDQPNSSLVKQVKLGKINSKKKDLRALETTLKKRISQLRELCLQEGDITGQLPFDYPLQPREPIPQIRRRQKNDNLNDTYCVQPIDTTISRQQYKHLKQYDQSIIPNYINGGNSMQFHPRPTSTNSTNSSLSVYSSNSRRSNQNRYGTRINSPAYTSPLHQPSFDNGLFHISQQNNRQNHTPNLYDTPLLSNNFKQCANKLNDTFENDAIGYMRASSISSFSSSSGSRTSSTLSNSTLSKSSYSFPMNSHLQSYPDSLSGDDNMSPSSRQNKLSSNELKNSVSQRQKLGDLREISEAHQNKLIKMMNIKLNFESKDCRDNSETLEQPQNFNIDGIGKFQPYYEETKPFQMSDFYKYSTKYRQKIDDSLKAENEKINHPKEGLLIETTFKNKNNYSSCGDQEDQIQASMKLIEKSGQKLIETTAKAIAGNPGLAEKINNILPMCL